jgi:hypothetical protein
MFLIMFTAICRKFVFRGLPTAVTAFKLSSYLCVYPTTMLQRQRHMEIEASHILEPQN